MCSGVQASWEDRNRGDWERNQKASLSHGTQYIKDKVLLTLRLPIPISSHAPFPEVGTLLPFFFQPHILWDHSFLTRDQTGPLAVKVQSLNHWTAREAPPLLPNFFSSLFSLMHLFFTSFLSICRCINVSAENTHCFIPYFELPIAKMMNILSFCALNS